MLLQLKIIVLYFNIYIFNIYLIYIKYFVCIFSAAIYNTEHIFTACYTLYNCVCDK